VRVGKALPRDALDPEVERLFAVIEDVRDAAMFGLMVGAGLRVSEVVNLRIADLERVNLAEQLVLLRVQGKGHKERIVWLTATWHGKVIAWPAERPEAADDHRFLNQHKRKLSKDGVQFRLKQYCAQAGVSLTCSQLRQCEASLRDTFATRLLTQGVSLEVVRKLPGHSSLQMSQH
jgi:site-specific recombinase XerD